MRHDRSSRLRRSENGSVGFLHSAVAGLFGNKVCGGGQSVPKKLLKLSPNKIMVVVGSL